MKPIPLAIILIVSIVGGRFVGLEWAASSAKEADAQVAESDLEPILEMAGLEAEELVQGHFAERKKRDAARLEDIDATRMKAIEDLQSRIERSGEIMTGSESAMDDLAETLELDMEPEEVMVAWSTYSVLADDFELGRLLIDPDLAASVRQQGIRHLVRAAEKGNAEAITLLMSLFDDPDQSVARDALRRAARLTNNESEEVAKAIKDSGLEASLVSLLPTLEGGTHRNVLDALTDLESPAAAQAWRQIYNQPDVRNRDMVSAARALKELGSPGEYDQLVLQLEYDLSSTEGRESRAAIGDLRRLGGDGARAALQRALDSNPDGPNTDSLKRAIERLDRAGTAGGARQTFDRGFGRGFGRRERD